MISVLLLATIALAADRVPLQPGNYEVKVHIESDEGQISAVEDRVRRRCVSAKHLATQTPFSFFAAPGQCQVSDWTGGKSATWAQFCMNKVGIAYGGLGRLEFGRNFYTGRILLRTTLGEEPIGETRMEITAKRLGDCGATAAKPKAKPATRPKPRPKQSRKRRFL